MICFQPNFTNLPNLATIISSRDHKRSFICSIVLRNQVLLHERGRQRVKAVAHTYNKCSNQNDT